MLPSVPKKRKAALCAAFLFLGFDCVLTQVAAAIKANHHSSKLIMEKLNSAEAYNDRGMERAENDDLAGAIADYTEAIAIDPNYAEAYYNRAYDRSELRDYKGAIEDYDKVIELAPDAAPAYFNRGLAKAKLGDAEGANTDCEYAKSLGL